MTFLAKSTLTITAIHIEFRIYTNHVNEMSLIRASPLLLSFFHRFFSNSILHTTLSSLHAPPLNFLLRRLKRKSTAGQVSVLQKWSARTLCSHPTAAPPW